MRLSRQQKVMLGGKVQGDIESLRTPMTGWNTRDDFEGMDPTDAIIMDNWYADVGGLSVRLGTQKFAFELGGAVMTLAEYYSKGNRKFFAAANNRIIDITGGGTGIEVGNSFQNDYWGTQNFKDRLFWTNGNDEVQVYDGATLGPAGFTGFPGGDIPVGVFLFKERLYFWFDHSNSFCYAGLDAVTGPVTEFPLSTVSKYGGDIMLLTNFSHDGGDGITNQFAIVMTTGEVILYLGNDPSLTTTWQLTGTYKLAQPVSRRAVAGYGGESYITTFDDHLGLQEQLVALKVGQTPPRSKISGAVAEALREGQQLQPPSCWDALFYAKGRRLMFNIPRIDGTCDQHVFNTSNQAWQRFRGMRAQCWSEFNSNLYYGDPDGNVFQADTGGSDDGVPITAECQQAYNKLQVLTRKRTAGVRPVISALIGQGYEFYVGYDYKPLQLVIVVEDDVDLAWWAPPPPEPSAIWDVTLWSPDSAIDTHMHSAQDTGTAISFSIKFTGVVPFSWLRTDLLLVPSNTY